MDSLIGRIVAIALTISIVLLFRAVVLWYLKVDEGIALLKSIDEKLGRMAGTSTPPVV